MALPTVRELLNPDRLRPLLLHYNLLRIVPGDATLQCEVERAPDSAGAPGTYAALATIGPFPKSGGAFIDPRPNDGATWWYRARHVGPNLSPGSYLTAGSSIARPLGNLELSAALAAASPFSRTEDLNEEAVTPLKAENRHRCRVKRSSDYALTNLLVEKIPFNAEVFDTGNLHSNSTNPERVTFPTGADRGFWIVNSTIYLSVSGTVGDSFFFGLGASTGGGTGLDEGRWVIEGNEVVYVTLKLTSFYEFAPADYCYVTVTPTFASGTPKVLAGSFLEVLHVW